jgi:hypothetical protein
MRLTASSGLVSFPLMRAMFQLRFWALSLSTSHLSLVSSWQITAGVCTARHHGAPGHEMQAYWGKADAVLAA